MSHVACCMSAACCMYATWMLHGASCMLHGCCMVRVMFVACNHVPRGCCMLLNVASWYAYCIWYRACIGMLYIVMACCIWHRAYIVMVYIVMACCIWCMLFGMHVCCMLLHGACMLHVGAYTLHVAHIPRIATMLQLTCMLMMRAYCNVAFCIMSHNVVCVHVACMLLACCMLHVRCIQHAAFFILRVCRRHQH